MQKNIGYNTGEKERSKWDEMLYMFDPGGDTIPVPIPDDDMLDTEWSQSGGGNPVGYNWFVPYDNGVKGPAGCSAVALAQVLKFWSCQVEQTGSNSYYDSYLSLTLAANFGNTDYNWASMGLVTADLENAQLIYHAGVALNTKYRATSGEVIEVWHIEDALENYFGFNSSCDFRWRINNNAAWETMLITNIAQGRPVIYNAGDFVASPPEGHSWVISGYDPQTDAFWCNWGWGGSHNDYYALGAFNPNTYPQQSFLNEMESAIFDIVPNLTSGIGIPVLSSSTIQSGANTISIPPVMHATSYEWTTTHGTITGTTNGGTTETLTTTESAMVCVRAFNDDCEIYSGWDCGMMTIVDPEITGPSFICGYSNNFVLDNYDPSATIVWTKAQMLIGLDIQVVPQ